MDSISEEHAGDRMAVAPARAEPAEPVISVHGLVKR